MVEDQKLFGRVSNESELYFKLKRRRLRVQILGDKVTTVEIDDSMVISEVIFKISDMLNLTNPEEYALKRPEHRDDNSKWLPLDRTLENAGIMPQDELLFMKKLFYYDKFIDEKDEVALNMLFGQTRDAILDGTLELDSEEEAAIFGSLIYMNVVGPYEEEKATDRISDLSPYVPPKYAKNKKVGAAILKKWKALGGPTLKKSTTGTGAPDHASYQKKYVVFMAQNKSKLCQLARTKPLYGYTYFDASMKKRRRRALRKSKKFEAKPIILALGRDYILVLDPKKNKERLIEHHYQEVLQWQGTGNKLTIDCAEYEDSLLTFLTSDAEPIAEYIRSYIALHRRRVDDPVADPVSLPIGDGDDSGRAGPSGPSSTGFALRPPEEDEEDIPHDIMEVKTLIEELPLDNKQVVEGPPLDAASDEDRLVATTKAKDTIQSELVRASKASQLLLLSAMNMEQDSFDAADLLRASRDLDDALSKLIGEVGVAAGISDEDGDVCLDDMQKLAANASVMVKAATVAALGTAAGEVDTIAFGDLLDASRDVGKALENLLGSAQVIGTLNDIPELPSNILDLLGAADAVAAALKDMNGMAPRASRNDETPEGAVVAKMQDLGLEADKLRSYLSLGSVSMEDSDSLGAMGTKIDTLRLGLAELDDLLIKLPDGNDDLLAAAGNLRDALAALLGAKEDVINPADRSAQVEEAAGLVKEDVANLIELISSDRLKKKRLLVAMKGVANDAAQLGLLADLEAQSVIDSELQKSLLNAAKDLSEAMMGLISAATSLSKHLDSEKKQRKAIVAAAMVGDYATQFMMVRRRIAAMNALVKDGKTTLSAVDLTLSEASLEINDIRNEFRKDDLDRAMHASGEPKDALVKAIYVFLAAPNDEGYQANLITVAGTCIRRFTNLAQASNAAAALSDDSVYLLSAAQALADALASLKGSLKTAKNACWQLEVDEALENMKESIEDATIAIQDFEEGHLEPESNATQQSAQDTLLNNASAMETKLDLAVAAVLEAKHAELSSSLKLMADEIQDLVDAAEAVAVNSAEPSTTEICLHAGEDAAKATLAFAKIAKTGMVHNSDPSLETKVTAGAEELKVALDNLLRALPGIGTIDRAIAELEARISVLDQRSLPGVDSEDVFEDAKAELSGSVRALASGLIQLQPACDESPDALDAATKTSRDLALTVLEQSMKCAALTEVTTARSSIVASVRTAGDKFVKTLQATKAYAMDHLATEAKTDLRSAADETGMALQVLLTALASGELVEGDSASANCEMAAQRIHSAAQKLKLENLPEADESGFKDAQSALLSVAREVSEVTDQLVEYGSSGNGKRIGGTAMEVAEVAVSLVDAVLEAAASLPGTGPSGLSPAVFKPGVKKCLDAIRTMIQADSAKKPDKAMLKSVAGVGRAVMGLAKLIEDKTELVEDESVVGEMKDFAVSLQKSARKLILAAGAYVPKRDDHDAKSKFLSRAKNVAVKCTKLNEFAKIRFAGAGDKNKASAAAVALAMKKRELEKAAAATGGDGGEGSSSAGGGGGGDALALASLGDTLPPGVMNQLNLLGLAGDLADALCQLVGASKVVASASSSGEDASASQQMLAASTGPVESALSALVDAARYAGPGEAACEKAIETGTGVAASLASTGLNISVGGVELSASPDHGLYVNDLLNAARELSDALSALSAASGSSTKALAGAAEEVDGDLRTFEGALIKVATTSSDVASAAQTVRLGKDVVEQSVSVLRSARDAGGDANEARAVRATAAGVQVTLETLQALLDFLGSLAASGHDCDVAIVNIANALKSLDRAIQSNSSRSHRECEKALRSAAKKLVGAMAKIVHASKDAPDSLGAASKDAAKVFPELVSAVVGELALVGDAGGSDSPGAGLERAMRDLGGSCIALVEAAKAVEVAPSDASAKADVSTRSESVTKDITGLLLASKEVGSMQKVSEEAKRVIEEALVELSTSLYLASNGQLYVRATEPFKAHEDKIDGQCKTVAHAVSEILKVSDKTAESLGKIALHSAEAVQRLILIVIAGASGLESNESQKACLEAAKALGESFIEFIAAGQTCVDTPSGSPARKKAKKGVKHTAKAVAMNIAAMINAAKEAASSASVGAKALAAALAKITSAREELEAGVASPAGASGSAEPASVIPLAKGTNTAAAKLYFASTKTQDVVAAKADDLGEQAAALLGLIAAVGAIPDLSEKDVGDLLGAARAIADALAALIGGMEDPSVTPGDLAPASREVGTRIATLVSVVSFLGQDESGSGGDGEGGSDAERALLSAADSIEEAAARLRALQTEQAESAAAATAAGQYHSSLLGNCLEMATTTVELVRAATAAQQEIVATGGEHEGEKFHADPVWAEGLISAAHEVVAATEQLVIYADAFVKGEGDDAYIVAASQVVSSSTAHLVMAARAKAPSLSSKPQVRLDTAAKGVKRATRSLVSTIEAGIEDEVEGVDESKLSIVAKFQRQEKIARMEEELRRLQQNLNK